MNDHWGSILSFGAVGLIYLVFARFFAGRSGDPARDHSQSINYRLLGTSIVLIAIGFGVFLVLGI